MYSTLVVYVQNSRDSNPGSLTPHRHTFNHCANQSYGKLLCSCVLCICVLLKLLRLNSVARSKTEGKCADYEMNVGILKKNLIHFSQHSLRCRRERNVTPMLIRCL